jgi:hypothetical protein
MKKGWLMSDLRMADLGIGGNGRVTYSGEIQRQQYLTFPTLFNFPALSSVGKDTPKTTHLSYTLIQVAEGCCA